MTQAAKQAAAGEAEISAALRAIAGHILDVEADAVPIDVPFLALGADSLTLVEMLRAIYERFSIRMTVRQLFEEVSTVSQVTQYLLQHAPAAPPPTVPRAASEPVAPPPQMPAPPRRPPAATAQTSLDVVERVLSLQLEAFNQLVAQQMQLLKRLGRAAPPARRPQAEMRQPAPAAAEAPARPPQTFPLTVGQKELYTLTQLDPAASVAYNEPLVLRLEGPLRWSVFAAALRQAVARHEALRTVFPGEGEVQEVRARMPVELPLVDLAALPAPKRPGVVRAVERQSIARSFDLARGPLVRPLLVRLAADQHLLVVTCHHLVIDGVSTGILMRELIAIYEATVTGRAWALPPPLPFRRYAAWLEKERETTAAADEAYWRARFADSVPVFEPPTDRPRAGARSFRGRQQRTLLEPEVVAGLETLGREHGASFFMTVFAAYSLLLHRWTGQDDLVVGVPFAHRPYEGGDQLVGHCVDVMPVRSRYQGQETFAGHLAAVRRRLLEAQEHNAYPFARLVQLLGLTPDLSRAPLVNVVLNLLQRPPLPPVAGLEIRHEAPEIDCVKFEIALHMLRTDEGLELRFESSRNLYATTAQRLLRHFVGLLSTLTSTPPAAVAARRLTELPLWNGPERHQALWEWNDTATFYSRERSLAELFAEQAMRTPEAVAVEYGEEVLSYGELDARARRLAGRLRPLGVGPDRLVGLFMEREAEMVVATVGIVLAGGAYLPLELDCPRERLAFMLEDAGAVAVVTGAEWVGRLPEGEVPVVLVDRSGTGTGTGAGTGRGRGTGENLAYVIYTSGSTGVPKGVAVPQRAVVRLVLETDYVQLGPGDGVAQAATIAFDAATFEIWGPLLTGGRIVGVSKDLALSPAELAAELERRRVRTLFLTTALFYQTMQERPDAFRSLREVLFGGEAVAPDRVRECLGGKPPQRLLHVYGPTEATTFALWHPVREVEGGVPIGRPLANRTAYVVDRNLRRVPIGSHGELVLGGAGLARGYLARPALTAEHFVPDPFGTAGGRLYRTGDRVRQGGGGAIEFLGRFDFQVKIRGFRIEPGEVEAVLNALPAVRESVVVVREDGGERRLVAYAALREGDGMALRTELAQRLPSYMVPAAFVILPALPLTPNRKVDQAALPAPADHEVAPAAVPRTPVEEILAGIWQQVLGRRRIGVHDHFFHLGGHSLLATRVVSGVRDAFGVELPLRALFETPTLAGLSRRIEAARKAGETPPAPPIEPVPRLAGGMPLSFAQQRLWFLHRLLPASPFYNMPFALRLTGPLNLPALAATLNEIVRRHEILRTTFDEVGGETVQIIHPPTARRLPLADLRALRPEARETQARRLARDEAERRFDLMTGPVFRTALLRLDENDHVLLLTKHHILSDGWSVGVFYRELAVLYRAFTSQGGGSLPLPELSVQYVDFAVWQRRWLSGDTLRRPAGLVQTLSSTRPRSPGRFFTIGFCSRRLRRRRPPSASRSG